MQGVLIYEMISGWPPFFHDNPMKVYEKIISGKVNYPESFSKPLEDLVGKLLAKNPSKRLGNMKGGIADLTKHKWFGSFDWKGLTSGTIVPHYVPDLAEFNARIQQPRGGAPVAGDTTVTGDGSDSEGSDDDEDADEAVRLVCRLVLLVTLSWFLRRRRATGWRIFDHKPVDGRRPGFISYV